jgi:hypothetical protein
VASRRMTPGGARNKEGRRIKVGAVVIAAAVVVAIVVGLVVVLSGGDGGADSRLQQAIAPLKAPVDQGLQPKLDADGKGHPPVASSSFVACRTPAGHEGTMPYYKYSFPLLVLGRQTTAGGYVKAAKRFVARAASTWRSKGFAVRRADSTGLRNSQKVLIADVYQAIGSKGGDYVRAVADFATATITLAGYGACPAD